MKKNEGVLDRCLRVVFAVALMVIGSLLVDGVLRLVLYVVALVLTFTALTGVCLLYRLLGIDTNK